VYGDLAGAGVPICENEALSPTYNMWSIAKNIMAQTPDWIPLLVTRNIDVSLNI
jgi:hypothetical protein